MNALAKLAPMPSGGPSGSIAALAFGLLAVFVAVALAVRQTNAAPNAPRSPWGY